MNWLPMFFFVFFCFFWGGCFRRALCIHDRRVYIDAMNFKPASTMKLSDIERACMNLRRFGPRHWASK
jgi:hypothetical protein